MEVKKTITLTIIGIIAFAISLMLIRFLKRKEKLKSESDGKIKLGYGIFFTSWVISFSFLNYKTISMLNEFADILFQLNSTNPITEILKTGVLFIGLANLWLIFSYYITTSLSVLFGNKLNDLNEIENNDYVYFILKGGLFVGFVYSLMPIFELVLRYFFPNIQIPFYR